MTLEELGLNAKSLIAGFSGGVIHALVFKQREPGAVIGSVVTGTLTANYLGPLAGRYVGDWLGDGGCGFVVGLAAMAICQWLVVLVSVKLRNAAGHDGSSKESPP